MGNISRYDKILLRKWEANLLREVNLSKKSKKLVVSNELIDEITSLWEERFDTDFNWKTTQEFINDMTYVSREFNLVADTYMTSGNNEKEDEYRKLAFSACDPISGFLLACRDIHDTTNNIDEKKRERAIKYLVDTIMLLEYYEEYYEGYSSIELKEILGEACYLLGGIFADFQDKDALSNIEALYWYQKSAENDYSLAKNMIKSLSTK